jgi:hypothetical protein
MITILDAMLEGDRLDARAMLAREVHAEHLWREHSIRSTPRSLEVDSRRSGCGLRAVVEQYCGEPLL